MDYKIIKDKDTSVIEKEVNKLLKKGYKINGNLIHFVDHLSSVPLFAQALILEGDVASTVTTPKEQKIVFHNREKIAKRNRAKNEKVPTNGVQQVSATLITNHAFIEILKHDGKVIKFVLKDCNTPPHVLEAIIKELHESNSLNHNNLKKKGVQFTSVAQEI